MDDSNVMDLALLAAVRRPESGGAVFKAAEAAGARIDGSPSFWFNTDGKPVLATALKYAEYKVAALNAALNGGAQVGTSNTNNREALLALVAAQDL
jgi:outer membrane usher protein FimD/PapC